MELETLLRPRSLTGSSGSVTLQRLSHAQPATSPVQCRSACQGLKLEVDVTWNASCQALRSHRPSRPGAACECGTAGLGRRRVLPTPVSDLRRNRYGRNGAAQLDRGASSELGLELGEQINASQYSRAHEEQRDFRTDSLPCLSPWT